MKLLLYPLRVLGAIMDRICAVLGAATLSQVPGYMSQYSQRLAGHVTEAERNVQGWREIAERTAEGSLEQLIALYRGSDLPATVEAGEKCLADVSRLEELRIALAALQDAPVWGRAFALMRHADMDVARGTLGSYVPNVPLDVESLTYAAIGLVLGILIFAGLKTGCKSGCKRAVRRLRRRRALEPAAAPAS